MEEKTSPAIEEIATTIIIIGETIPALTAASPKIKPPNIEIALPLVADIRTSLSLNISQINNIPKASIRAGKGTPSRWLIKLVKSFAGMDS